jgi:hypothetical protein
MTAPPFAPLWNAQGAIRPGSPTIGQPTIYTPPALGAEQYGGYGGLTKQTYDRTRIAPTDFWFSQPYRLIFLPTGDEGVVGRATFRTPVFDCRPDMKHATSSDTEQAQPIWTDGAKAAGLCLYVFIDNIFLITEDLRVSSIQFGHPLDSFRANLTTLQAPQDISSDFFDGREGVILRWALPGYRFWKLNLRFDQLTGNINDVGTVLTVQAALY